MAHDIDEARRKAMKFLEDEIGGATAAAEKVGMTYTQWVNLRSGAADSKTGKPRGMRKATARKIEKAFGRDESWLDIADLIEPGIPTEAEANAEEGTAEYVLKAWKKATEQQRSMATFWAKSVLETHR